MPAPGPGSRSLEDRRRFTVRPVALGQVSARIASVGARPRCPVPDGRRSIGERVDVAARRSGHRPVDHGPSCPSNRSQRRRGALAAGPHPHRPDVARADGRHPEQLAVGRDLGLGPGRPVEPLDRRADGPDVGRRHGLGGRDVAVHLRVRSRPVPPVEVDDERGIVQVPHRPQVVGRRRLDVEQRAAPLARRAPRLDDGPQQPVPVQDGASPAIGRGSRCTRPPTRRPARRPRRRSARR
jgi:hypothetical protein